MPPVEFHRYLDGRGSTIVYKFDPAIARRPDPRWPNDSAITVYRHYMIIRRNGTVNFHSDLLPLEFAMERSRTDNLSSQPIAGKVMYTEHSPAENESATTMKTQYIWKGWTHDEGYRRGWAKLHVHAFDRALPVPRVPQTAPLRDDQKTLEKILNRTILPVETRPIEQQTESCSVQAGFDGVSRMRIASSPPTPAESIRQVKQRHSCCDTLVPDAKSLPTVTQGPASNISCEPRSNMTALTNTVQRHDYSKEEKEEQAHSRKESLEGVTYDLEDLFADMPMLLYAVKQTGGLQQFRASLVDPKATQILDRFLFRTIGRAPAQGPISGRNRKGKKWDYWVVKYKHRLEA